MPTIEFRIDVTGMPHSFIVMDNGGGVIQGFGFAPKEENSPYGSGWIYDNIEHEYDYTTGPIEVTTEQYNAMVDYINNSIHNPPDYNLPGSLFFPSTVQQCAQWIMDVAQHGNVTLPFTMHRGGWNPYGQAIWINVDGIAENVADFFNAAIPDILESIKTKMDVANQTVSPIILDLDGDGVETTRVNSGANIEHKTFTTEILYTTNRAIKYALYRHRNYIWDARHLYLIQTWKGQGYLFYASTYAATSNPGPQKPLILKSSIDLFEYGGTQLVAQTVLRTFYDEIASHRDETSHSIRGYLILPATQLTSANDEEWRKLG